MPWPYSSRSWVLSFCLLAVVVVHQADCKAGGGGVWSPSGVKGIYTYPIDERTSVGVGYDLAEDSRFPFSIIRSASFSKSANFPVRDRTARVRGRYTLLPHERVSIAGANVDYEGRTVGVELHDGAKRIQCTFSRMFGERLRIILSPLVTYGYMRDYRQNFTKWLPTHKPPSLVGVPRLSLEQNSVCSVWDERFPDGSWLRDMAVRVSLRAGDSRGHVTMELIDGRKPNRLWKLGIDVPIRDPLDASFAIERQWQVYTMPERSSTPAPSSSSSSSSLGSRRSPASTSTSTGAASASSTSSLSPSRGDDDSAIVDGGDVSVGGADGSSHHDSSQGNSGSGDVIVIAGGGDGPADGDVAGSSSTSTTSAADGTEKDR